MNRYTVVWSHDDQQYVATNPDFPGLSAFGDTEEEALEEAKIAAGGFKEIEIEDNNKK